MKPPIPRPKARRPRVKTVVKEASQVERAKLNVQESVERRTFPERLKRAFLEKVTDPAMAMKLLAVLGATVLIHDGIQWGTYNLGKLEAWAKVVDPFSASQGLVQGTYLESLVAAMNYDKKEAPTPDMMADMARWLVSFMLAYLIVENFGELVKAGGNLITMAKSLLPTGALT